MTNTLKTDQIELVKIRTLDATLLVSSILGLISYVSIFMFGIIGYLHINGNILPSVDLLARSNLVSTWSTNLIIITS